MTVAGLRVSRQSDSGRRQVRVREEMAFTPDDEWHLERHDFDKGRWDDGWCSFRSFPLCDIRAS